MHILGISAFDHDSAACLLRDGHIIAAAQEERFSRKKHDSLFPKKAVDYCLVEGGIGIEDVEAVVFHEDPRTRFERLLAAHLLAAPRSIGAFCRRFPSELRRRFFMRSIIRKAIGYKGAIHFMDPRYSQAAAAFFPSPFTEAAILTLGGLGEWTATAIGTGRGNRIALEKEIPFPHSLHFLYSAFTHFCGFRVNGGEHQLMGLAPYGEPRFVEAIKREFIDMQDDGHYRLKLCSFDPCSGRPKTIRRFADLFEGPPRASDAAITQREMDLARSVQAVVEECVLRIAHAAHRDTGMKRLCLAGGMALNGAAGRLLREGPFEEIWIQPAAGNEGNALGCALLAWRQILGNPRTPDRNCQLGSYLGPAFSDEQIASFLDAEEIAHERLREEEIARVGAGLLGRGRVVGWFQGRMEFGRSALGARSILGDARSREMPSILNRKIGSCESFRPFSASVLREHVQEWFELDRESPYKLLAACVRPERLRDLTAEEQGAQGFDKRGVVRSEIPAVTHVDNSVRVQTVDAVNSPRFHALIQRFYEDTGCPVIINAPFHVQGEPLVCTPAEAYACFMRTDMDYLIMGAFLLDKAHQKPWKDAHTTGEG